MCGDPYQLPPTIKASGAAKKALGTRGPTRAAGFLQWYMPSLTVPPDLCRRPLDRTTESTLFDRFARGRENTVVKMLTIQYRMNKKIMAWSSSAMYQNKLVADPAVRTARRYG